MIQLVNITLSDVFSERYVCILTKRMNVLIRVVQVAELVLWSAGDDVVHRWWLWTIVGWLVRLEILMAFDLLVESANLRPDLLTIAVLLGRA